MGYNRQKFGVLLQSIIGNFKSIIGSSLAVWGPPLDQQLLQHLERTQNHPVRLCKNLSKFVHVSEHYYQSLSWLPLWQLIQFRSVGMMYNQYHHSWGIPLSPPIKFGRCQSAYDTRSRVADHFANLRGFTLVFPDSHFFLDFFALRYLANWWN